MINLYHFIDSELQLGYNFTLDSIYINHANSILTNNPIYSEIEIQNMFVKY